MKKSESQGIAVKNILDNTKEGFLNVCKLQKIKALKK
jgi:hypothetical protein